LRQSCGSRSIWAAKGGYREPVGEPAREHPTVGCRGYRRPVLGAEKVARFLVAITVEEQTARFLESVGSDPSGEVRVHLAQVNAEMGSSSPPMTSPSRRSSWTYRTALCGPSAWWRTPRSWAASRESSRLDEGTIEATRRPMRPDADLSTPAPKQDTLASYYRRRGRCKH
jgi:hypothetical protein